jgi:hypothetical protein
LATILPILIVWLPWLSVALALVSAWYWFKASRIPIPPTVIIPGAFGYNRNADLEAVLAQLREQSRLNVWGAGFIAGSILVQAIGTLLAQVELR